MEFYLLVKTNSVAILDNYIQRLVRIKAVYQNHW